MVVPNMSGLAWRKSTYSASQGQCVEVAPMPGGEWHKSSHSAGSGQCVEVAGMPGAVGVRDSKNRSVGALVAGPRTWRAFVASISRG